MLCTALKVALLAALIVSCSSNDSSAPFSPLRAELNDRNNSRMDHTYTYSRPLLIPEPAAVARFDPELFAGDAPHPDDRCEQTGDPVARAQLGRILSLRLRGSEEVEAALQRFDDLVARGQAPHVVAAVLSLVGTSASALVDQLLDPRLVIEVGRLEPGISGRADDAGQRIVVSDRVAPVIAVAGAVLAHEVMHVRPGNEEVGRYEEAVATVVGSLAYVDQILTDPELAEMPCSAIRGENSWLLAMLNSGPDRIDLEANTPRVPAPFLTPYGVIHDIMTANVAEAPDALRVWIDANGGDESGSAAFDEQTRAAVNEIGERFMAHHETRVREVLGLVRSPVDVAAVAVTEREDTITMAISPVLRDTESAEVYVDPSDGSYELRAGDEVVASSGRGATRIGQVGDEQVTVTTGVPPSNRAIEVWLRPEGGGAGVVLTAAFL